MKKNQNQVNITTAYSAALKIARTGGGKLTQEKAGIIALKTITTLFKDDGTPLLLTAPQRTVVKVLFHPKTQERISVLKDTLKAAGCTLDDTTLELLTPLFTPANFDKKLEDMKKAPTVDWNKLAGDEEEETPTTEPGPTNAPVAE